MPLCTLTLLSLLLQFAGVTVDRSFDVWGLGMAVLHLYNGKSYFEGSSDPQVQYHESHCTYRYSTW